MNSVADSSTPEPATVSATLDFPLNLANAESVGRSRVYERFVAILFGGNCYRRRQRDCNCSGAAEPLFATGGKVRCQMEKFVGVLQAAMRRELRTSHAKIWHHHSDGFDDLCSRCCVIAAK